MPSPAPDPEYDPDALALASMIADYLRGTPIAVDELPPGAWRLVAGYVAAHDYGPAHGQTVPSGATFMGAPLRIRLAARGPDGQRLPNLPPVERRSSRQIIDAEPAAPAHRELPPSGGNVR